MSVRIMADVWDLDLPRDEKIVLLAFADHANDEGACYPSIERIAHKCGYSHRSVQRKIKGLEGRHLLLCDEVGGGRRTSQYRVDVSRGVKLSPLKPRGVTRVTAEVTELCHRRDDTAVSPKPSTQPSTEPSPQSVPANGSTAQPTPGGEYTPKFCALWGAHPHGGKRSAWKAYIKAVPVKVRFAVISSSLESYHASLRDGFRGANLSTWINGEQWEEILPDQPNGRTDGAAVSEGSAARYY